MSLILDALRKADAERQSRERPAGLESQPLLAEPVGSRGRWSLFAVLLVLVSLALGWWLWPLLPGEVIKTPEGIESTPSSAPAAFAPVANEPVVAAPPEPRLQTLYERVHPVSGEETEVGDAKEPAASPDRNTIASLYQQQGPSVSPAAIGNSDNPDVQAVSPPSRQGESVNAIRDLPLSVQNRIPTLMYAAHDYLEGNRPSVVINGQRYYEGQALEQGLKLERIEQDGVVIRVDDHRFKLRALSSWVNM